MQQTSNEMDDVEYDDYFEASRVIPTVESSLPFGKSTKIFHVICFLLMLDAMAFTSSNAPISRFWVWMLPNILFVFSEMWTTLGHIRYWIAVYTVFLPTFAWIRIGFRSEDTNNIWFVALILFFTFCVSFASYVSARHKLKLANLDLHLRHQLFVERREHKNIMTSLMPERIAELILLKGMCFNDIFQRYVPTIYSNEVFPEYLPTASSNIVFYSFLKNSNCQIMITFSSDSPSNL